MEKVTLKFKRIEVTKVDTRNNVLEMAFFMTRTAGSSSTQRIIRLRQMLTAL